MKKATWFVFFSFLAISCLNEPDCYLLSNNEIDVYFRVLGFGADIIQTKSIIGQNVVDWNVYNDGGDTLSQITLPLNPKAENVSFVLNYVNNKVYNLTVGYDHKVQFVSEDCGSRDIFTSLKALEHNFDTVHVGNPTPTQPHSRNVDVFRCPTANLLGIKFDVVTHLESITVDSLAVYTPQNKEVETIVLPFDTNAEKKETNFIFDFGGDVKRTLSVKYAATERILGNACGKHTFFTELNINADKPTTLTKATVLNKSLIDPVVVNIEITK